jgi:hypothetical protein
VSGEKVEMKVVRGKFWEGEEIIPFVLPEQVLFREGKTLGTENGKY